MKLINLLIRKLNNCSLGGDFRVLHHAEICQSDRFSLEITFKRAHSCKDYGIPRLGLNLKKNILYLNFAALSAQRTENKTRVWSNMYISIALSF